MRRFAACLRNQVEGLSAPVALVCMVTSLLSSSVLAAPPEASSLTISGEKPQGPVSRGWVSLELDKKNVGTGVLLGGDGRILAAYRVPRPGEPQQLVARFSDGSQVTARVAHTDRKLGLALLVPERGKRKDGIRASEEPLESEGARPWIAANRSAPPLKLVPFVHAKGTSDEVAGVFKPVPGTSIPMGIPLIDDRAHVVGLLTRLCSSGGEQPSCTTEAIVPVAQIRSFLGRAPATAALPSVWLGLAGDPTVLADGRPGVRVLAVAPKSPAEKAKLVGDAEPSKSDVVVAVDGKPVASVEELAAQVNERGVGDKVKFEVIRGEKKRTVQLVLESAP